VGVTKQGQYKVSDGPRVCGILCSQGSYCRFRGSWSTDLLKIINFVTSKTTNDHLVVHNYRDRNHQRQRRRHRHRHHNPITNTITTVPVSPVGSIWRISCTLRGMLSAGRLRRWSRTRPSPWPHWWSWTVSRFAWRQPAVPCRRPITGPRFRRTSTERKQHIPPFISPCAPTPNFSRHCSLFPMVHTSRVCSRHDIGLSKMIWTKCPPRFSACKEGQCMRVCQVRSRTAARADAGR